MRLSKAFFRTFKEPPSEAEVISHQLLERGGYIRKLGRGSFIYTPLMWRVLQKVTSVIRQELDRVGCQEISMPLLHPSELWKETGRWEGYTAEKLLYTLEDREGHPYCLGPTHEEIVTYLVSNWMTSHKNAPFILYQIGTKFRDEIRPRFGLIRGKEFLMNDVYSFSTSSESMEAQYEIMRKAYSRIFERLGLDFVIVEAHGGKIGKGKSEEFQVKAEIGEDAVMVAGTYAANVEAAIATPPSYTYEANLLPLEPLPTPGISTIEALGEFTKLPPHRMVKSVLYKLTYPTDEKFVAVGIRGDRSVNEVKVATHFAATEIALASDEEILKATGCKTGFAGPINLRIPYLADLTCEPMTNFVTAGNTPDVHYLNANWGRDCPKPTFSDVLLAEEGDLCPNAPGERYRLQRGIEVGHIFNLGTRYSEKLKACFQDEEGQMRPYWMGTYGIGVGRVAASIVEQKHDEKGMIWPLIVAPYRILITAAVTNRPEQVEAATAAYNRLNDEGFEPLYDDREERLGFKLKDSDLIGIPYKLIVGKAFLQEGKFEIESRAGTKELIEKDQLLNWALIHLKPGN